MITTPVSVDWDTCDWRRRQDFYRRRWDLNDHCGSAGWSWHPAARFRSRRVGVRSPLFVDSQGPGCNEADCATSPKR